MPNKVDEVYGIARDIPLNYISREAVDQQFVDSLTRQQHVVVYGSSKQGKTSLRKSYLNEDDSIVVHCSNKWQVGELNAAILKVIGYEITQSTTRSASGKNKIIAKGGASIFGIGAEASGEQTSQNETKQETSPLELDPEDVNDIIKALGEFSKFIILEDFHYLPVDTQRDFAVALKAFHEQSKLIFIIIGVWLEESRLSVYNGDLTGRIVGINADAWTRDELDKVIASGESLLNVTFDPTFRAGLLDNCFEAVYIVQEACRRACLHSKVYEEGKEKKTVGEGLDAEEVIESVVSQQNGRYNSFLTSFAAGFQETELQMYKWLLYPILTTNIEDLQDGLRYRAIRESLKRKHPVGAGLNAGNVTQALQFTASLQVQKNIKPIVLDYDQTNLVLNVVDRGFLIWLSNQSQKDLLELVDLPPD